jgi:outer membrane protein insertion porin family
VAAPLLTAGLLGAALAWGQTPVREVRLHAPGAAEPERLGAVFGIEPSSALSREEIRAGVQALLATGMVEDVAVELEEEPGGVVIHLEVQVASLVRTLVVEGLPRRYRRELETQLGLSVGAPVQVNRFVSTLQRVEESLRSRGYPDARLDPELSANLTEGTVDVAIRATLGAPRAFGELQAPGSDLATQELLEVCGLRPGERLSEGRLEGARRRLERHLRASGFWEAEVESPVLRQEGSLMTVVLGVLKRAHYRLDLSGVRNVKELGPEALPFLRGDEPFSDSALDVIANNLRVSLQQQGFLLARVELRIGEDVDGRVLQVKVERGVRKAIVAVRFPGAAAIPPETLLARVGARTGHPWRWGGEPVDEATLAADATSLLGTYQSEGFAEASVEPARLVDEDGGLAIEFPVSEGPRSKVTAVCLEGWPPDVPEAKLTVHTDGPWSQLAEDDSRATLLAALREAGYLDARVEASHRCADGGCEVRLDTQAGERSVVGRIVVAGLRRTRRSVVEKVARLRIGEVLGPERQLEIQRRLLGLGVFNAVDLKPIPGQTGGRRRGVVLGLGEGPTRALAFGAGWDTERKLLVSGSWSELSIFGTGRSFSLEGRYSSKELRVQATYREPASLGLLRFPSAVSVYRTEERMNPYDSLRRGMWVELGDRLRRPLRTILRYEYQIVATDAPEDVESSWERDKQSVRIASLTPTLEWDTRDDLFSPRRGILASLQYQWAFDIFEADAEFGKAQASVAGFRPLLGGVFAGSLRTGFIRDHSGVEVVPPEPINVPVNSRFYAGGRISHRAFPTDRLGIVGETLTSEGDPLGGGGLVLANLEWRFPVWGPVGASFFVDGGNVWRELRDIEVGEMRWGGGVGVRVETPVGPLRVEYGWKFDRAAISTTKMESPGQFYLSFGNPF